MVERIEDAFGLLAEDLLEEVEETELPEIEKIVEVVEPVIEKLDDEECQDAMAFGYSRGLMAKAQAVKDDDPDKPDN